jgi:hypothetical protein
MAYLCGLTAIVYHYVGREQEVDRLKEKDDFISQLVEEARVLSEQLTEQRHLMTKQIDTLKAEMNQQKAVLAENKAQQKRLIEEINKSDDASLEAYGDEVIEWLRSGTKTVLAEDITRFTGHSSRKIKNANLGRSPRNPDLILVSSLVQWLKNTPPPVVKSTSKDTDKLPATNGHNGHSKEPVNAEELEEVLV